MMKNGLNILCVVFYLVLTNATIGAVPPEKQSWFYKGLEYKGVAVREPGYHVWGSSPVIGPQGKTHLFAARWPVSAGFVPGWYTSCEIARYVSNSPEGPFVFSEVVVQGTGVSGDWDYRAPHNPCIQKIGDTYVLVYIANSGSGHPANQRIGMVTAPSLNGPWAKAGIDGMILAPPTDPSYWCHDSSVGVNNPAFLQHQDGRFFLYYKAREMRPGDTQNQKKMGLAIADNVEGPYVHLPEPITNNDMTIEDGYAFLMNGKYYLLTTDNHGTIQSGGGLLWKSDDGITFNDTPLAAFDLLGVHIPGGIPAGWKNYYGPGGDGSKMERPQVLMIDGKPAYFYAPSGTNIEGGDGSISYVFKFNPDNLSCGDWGYLQEDLDKNCIVDADDLALLAANWLVSGDIFSELKIK